MRPSKLGEFSWGVLVQGLARALGRAREPLRPVVIPDEDPWERQSSRREDRFSRMLGRIRQDALVVHAARGLPTLPGHYAMLPDRKQWTFVAETLTPEERWSMVERYPPEAGWRFSTLEHLGQNDPDERIAAASRVLGLARSIERSKAPGALTSALERALALGAEWQALTAGTRSPNDASEGPFSGPSLLEL